MDKPKVISMERTCYACPSQWDGITDDNRKVYIRYRHGQLSVSIGEPGDEADDAGVNGECIYAGDNGEAFHGFLTYDELREALKDVLDLPETSLGEEDATHEKAGEIFAAASENLNRLIKEGKVKVIDSIADLPKDAAVLTDDKETIAEREARGQSTLTKEDIERELAEDGEDA
jgi:hypothetical protein